MKTIGFFSFLDTTIPIIFRYITELRNSLEDDNHKITLSRLYGTSISQEYIEKLVEYLDSYDAFIFFLDDARDAIYFFNLGFCTCCTAVKYKPVVFLCWDDLNNNLCDYTGLFLNIDSTLNENFENIKSAIKYYIYDEIRDFWVAFSKHTVFSLNENPEISLQLKLEDEIKNDLQNIHPKNLTVQRIRTEVVLKATLNYNEYADSIFKILHSNIFMRSNYQINKNTCKIIKIFLASSSELKEDRDNFELYFRQCSDHYIHKNIYFKIIRWENFLDMMSKTRLQDEYNKAIMDCHIFISLYFTKAGKFTEEEFETAYKRFKEVGKPVVYTYFKNAKVNLSDLDEEYHNTIPKFKKKLLELGHYITEYTDIESLKRQFKDQLEKLTLEDLLMIRLI